MKKVIFLWMSGLIFSGAAFAQEKKLLPENVELSGVWAVYDKYVWRGFTLDKDPVIQTGVNLKYGNATAGIWNSNDCAYGDSVNSAELDYLFDYTAQIGKAALSAGYTYYNFPAASSSSREYYLGLSCDLPFCPGLTYYHDYKEKGDYIDAGISRSFPVMDGISLDISAHAGYNRKLFIAGKGGDYAVNASAPVRLTGSLTVTPNFGYSAAAGDLKNKNDGNQSSVTYGGLSLSYNF